MQHLLTEGRLLDDRGKLQEAGYATALVKTYSRGDIRAPGGRIKEWDYYLIYNQRFGVALTIDDNSYMGLISASFLDFEQGTEKTVSPMFWFPFGKTGFPASSVSGNVEKKMKGAEAAFTHVAGGRRLTCHMDDFGGEPFDCDILLTEEPADSMVIATPFKDKPTAFYYNQKILGMRALGQVRCLGRQETFDPADSFGMLDWGRGVWTYDNTWYWGAGHGMSEGHLIGYNIGYGFGDTSKASENMVFVDGKAHKLDAVTFHIPQRDGKDDYLAPWRFTESSGRFEMAYTPVLDRKSKTDIGVICSDQHQTFGYLDGDITLDDGKKLHLHHFMAMAEKVRNKW